VGFKPDKALEAVALGEARDEAVAVLDDAGLELACDTNVERAAIAVGHNIDGDVCIFADHNW
jgi:hypothetical protein